MDPEYIRNPESGRPIKVGGKVHRRIMREQQVVNKYKARELREAPPKKLRRETVLESDEEIQFARKPVKPVKKVPTQKQSKIKNNGKYKYYASSSEDDSSSDWTDSSSDDSSSYEEPIIRHPEYSDDSDESDEASESI